MQVFVQKQDKNALLVFNKFTPKCSELDFIANVDTCQHVGTYMLIQCQNSD